jgi:hypothetical protein
LTFDDALFDTMGRVLHAPVTTQTVWRFPKPLETQALARFHRGLSRGPLQRRIRRTWVPGARDRWVPHDAVMPLRADPTLAPDAVLAWVAAHAATPLDLERGPVWSLAYAPTADGGSAMSFVTSHVVADGSLKLRALEAAAVGDRLPVLPEGRGGLPADLRDAVGQWAGAARAVPSLLRSLRPIGSPTSARSVAGVAPDSDDDQPWTPPVVVFDVSEASWRGTAAAEAGSPNALLLAVCAEVTAALGAASPGATVRIASPLSTRGDGDLRSNASTGVTVPVTLSTDGRVVSLGEVRAAAREAYGALASRPAEDDPLAAARALLPLVPGWLVRRLAPSWPAPAVLGSHLGALPSGVVAPTGVAATSVLNRSITPPTTRGAARRTGSVLSAWWGSASGTATLCIAGANPDAAVDAETLRAGVAGVLRRRGLAWTSW